MILEEQLLKDFKKYLINKQTVEKNAIQLLRAEILNKSKEAHRDLTDEEILYIIAKEIKQKHDTIDTFSKANRPELVEQTKKEIQTLEKYIPNPLSIEELKSIIIKTISDLKICDKKQMGILIKEIKAKVGVRADGKTISILVKEILNERNNKFNM